MLFIICSIHLKYNTHTISVIFFIHIVFVIYYTSYIRYAYYPYNIYSLPVPFRRDKVK